MSPIPPPLFRTHRRRLPHRGRRRRSAPGRHHPESGQATAEYALVMLAAAAVAGLLLAWASGTGGIGRLL
ncbi:MAG: DUF4244 domain-containing protein, partial [Actinomycetota bacterium]